MLALLAVASGLQLALPAAGSGAHYAGSHALVRSDSGRRHAETIVSLEFDHAFSDALPGVELAASHKMAVTLFAMSGRVGLPGYMTYAELLALQAQGDEVGGHTIDHQDLSQLSAAAQRHEICDDRTALQQAGLDVTDFAYPYGHLNGATPAIVRGCGYESARGAGGLTSQGGCYGNCPPVETIAPQDPYLTRTVNSIIASTSLSTLERYVTRAQQYGGGWLQIVFHQVCDGCDLYSVSEPTLATFLTWLAARESTGIRVETVRQVIETPFLPAPVRVRVGSRPSTRLRPSERCPRAPITATCSISPAPRRSLHVRAGSALSVTTAAQAGRVQLQLGAHTRRITLRRALRADDPDGLRWTLPRSAQLRRGAATLLVSFPLGLAEYRLELVVTLPRR
jgi:peptidoglycan/xylan/chitin deacetylase (PgdA/CDA1 family)